MLMQDALEYLVLKIERYFMRQYGLSKHQRGDVESRLQNFYAYVNELSVQASDDLGSRFYELDKKKEFTLLTGQEKNAAILVCVRKLLKGIIEQLKQGESTEAKAIQSARQVLMAAKIRISNNQSASATSVSIFSLGQLSLQQPKDPIEYLLEGATSVVENFYDFCGKIDNARGCQPGEVGAMQALSEKSRQENVFITAANIKRAHYAFRNMYRAGSGKADPFTSMQKLDGLVKTANLLPLHIDSEEAAEKALEAVHAIYDITYSYSKVGRVSRMCQGLHFLVETELEKKGYSSIGHRKCHF